MADNQAASNLNDSNRLCRSCLRGSIAVRSVGTGRAGLTYVASRHTFGEDSGRLRVSNACRREIESLSLRRLLQKTKVASSQAFRTVGY